jgi:hypothetical protein
MEVVRFVKQNDFPPGTAQAARLAARSCDTEDYIACPLVAGIQLDYLPVQIGSKGIHT